MRFHFTASKTNISLLLGGRMYSIPSTHAEFDAVYAHLKLAEHDFKVLEELVDRPVMMARLTAGMVSVVGNTVYYAGSVLHNSLAVKLSNMLNEGFQAEPWGLFLNNLMENPNKESVKSLYDFLEQFDAPITEDGHFLAFKRVRDDYMDIHSGTMDNSPGNIVEMPRDEVDSNSNVTCSRGLHACATSYLSDFYSDTANGRILVLKINPRDVCAVPSDYNFAKMRVCRYEVIGDVENSSLTREEIVESSYVNTADVSPEPEPEPAPELATELFDLNYEHYNLVYKELILQAGEYFCVLNDYGDLSNIGIIRSVGVTGVVYVQWRNDHQAIPYGKTRLLDTCRAVERIREVAYEIPALSFTRAGREFYADEIAVGVDELGQRGYSRKTGVPRTTIQEWLKLIKAWDEL